ncbi:RNA-binding KH domain-containing protein PEPPER [Setaria italica]|uniref:RNA-binding KH domain-containing protein PEPPER n=1 Tax=Setaria italica TaxID=4555 RepID=UPI000BE5B2C1|nr:RNA-binding KH domain-containing protein PEPPER [Setaria italica]
MAPPPQEEEAAIDGIPEAGVEEEEDPEVVEPWVPSSDSEPEPDADRPALEPLDPFPASSKPELLPAQTAVAERKDEGEEARQRWPGWPGASVFRLVVPADQVGGVIGRRGSTIKRLCDETRARVRVLDAAHGAANRIVRLRFLPPQNVVLVSATEEVEAELSPVMNAAIKIFKHINGIEEINSDGTLYASAPEICSVRLLVPAAQAVHLIGKQGVTIKSIQESTGATIRIIDEDELLSCETPDERIVEIHGASFKVHNALKSVLGLLRKFLVDHGVLHLFDMKNQEVAQPQDTSKENQFIDDYPLAITQTMKIPLPYAEEIIGVRGENIEFIRSVSGAVVVLEEIGDYPDEATENRHRHHAGAVTVTLKLAHGCRAPLLMLAQGC